MRITTRRDGKLVVHLKQGEGIVVITYDLNDSLSVVRTYRCFDTPRDACEIDVVSDAAAAT